jgi:hypothetical protein
MRQILARLQACILMVILSVSMFPPDRALVGPAEGLTQGGIKE